MSLFDFFKKDPVNSASSDPKETLIPDKLDEAEQPTMLLEKPLVVEERPEIPEHIFIEYAKPNLKEPMDQNEEKQDVSDLQALYRYLEQNQDKKGYEDALINPDSSYMEEQVLYISNELGLLISKIKTYYLSYLRTIDFHIETRKRNGMLETVDELLTHKETVMEEMKIVSSIEEDSRNGKGLSQNPILSYKKGFRNGFAAITYNTVLSGKK